MKAFNQIRTLLAFISLFAAMQVQAATFTVTNTNASGAGSLSWAIEQANADPALSKIVFQFADNTPRTISTGSITILSSMEIDGSSADITLTSASLVIAAQSGSENITIRSLKMSGGYVAVASSSPVLLEKVDIEEVTNAVVLSNPNCTVSLVSCKIKRNASSIVGNCKSLSVDKSSLTESNSSGIEISAGELNISNSTISNNGRYGIEIIPTGTLNDAVISSCKIENNALYGIYNGSISNGLRIEKNTLTNNGIATASSSPVNGAYYRMGQIYSSAPLLCSQNLFFGNDYEAIPGNSLYTIPKINSITLEGTELVIKGNVDKKAKIELFWTDGDRQTAKQYVGSIETDNTGNFTYNISSAQFSGIINYFSATATYDGVSTSGLSNPAGYFKEHYYVKENGAGREDGSSWSNAMPGEVFAWFLPLVPDNVTFHIAAGTYRPVYDKDGKTAASASNNTFGIKSSVNLIGGYPATATTGNELSEPQKYKTLFDGNITGGQIDNMIYATPSEQDVLMTVSLKGLHIENTAGNAFITPVLGQGTSGSISELNLENITISNCQNYAIDISQTPVLTIKNSSFIKNKGVINSYSPRSLTVVEKIMLDSVRLEENNTNAVINCGQNRTLTMNKVYAKKNTARLVSCQMYAKELTITNSTFEENECTGSSINASWLSSSSNGLTITDSKFIKNTSGVSISADRTSKLTIERTIFEDNTGACLYTDNMTMNVIVDNCTFKGNKNNTTSYYGALVSTAGGTISNSIFNNNTTQSCILSSDKGSAFTNNTFSGNKSATLYQRSGGATGTSFICNSIVGNEFTDNVLKGYFEKIIGNIIIGNIAPERISISGASASDIAYNIIPIFYHNGNCCYQPKANETNIFVEPSNFSLADFNALYAGCTTQEPPTAEMYRDIILGAEPYSVFDGTYNAINGLFTPNLTESNAYTVALLHTSLPKGRKINSLPLSTDIPATDRRGELRKNPACIGAYELFLSEYYVKVNGDGNGDGSSWENAMSNETFAEYLPIVPDDVTFHIAAGTYRPVYDKDGKTAASASNNTFGIKSSVTLIGGYPATATTSNASFDPVANKTIFDGSIGEVEITNLIYADNTSASIIVNLKGLYLENTTGNAIYFNTRNTSSELNLDEVTVANSQNYAIYSTDPIFIKKSSFTENNGVINTGYSNVKITIRDSVRIYNNHGEYAVNGYAITLDADLLFAKDNTISNSLIQAGDYTHTITNSEFENNTCLNSFAFLINLSGSHGSNLTMTDCKIINNATARCIDVGRGSLTVKRTVFDNIGEHLFNYMGETNIDNCIFSRASGRNIISCEGGVISNCSFYNNTVSSALIQGNRTAFAFTNNTFAENEGTTLLNAGSATGSIFINNTIMGNTFSENVLSVYFDKIIGNIIIGNKTETRNFLKKVGSIVEYNIMPIYIDNLETCFYQPKTTETNIFVEPENFSLADFNALYAGCTTTERPISEMYEDLILGIDPYLLLEGVYDETTGLFNPELKDNGGFTPTVALTSTILPGDKLVNSLPLAETTVTTDQRGVERNELTAIGAYELKCEQPEGIELSLKAGEGALCRGDVLNIQLDGMPEDIVSDYSYFWSFETGNGNDMELASENNSTGVLARVLTTIKELPVSLTVTDKCGTKTVISKTFDISGNSEISFSGLEGSSFCSNAAPVELTGTPGNGIFKVNGEVITDGLFVPSSVEGSQATIRYEIEGEDGCSSYAEETVGLIPSDLNNINIELIPTPTTCLLSSDGQIEASVAGEGTYRYKWKRIEETGETDLLENNSALLTDIGAGNYIFILIDGNDCFTEAKATVDTRTRTTELQLGEPVVAGDMCKNTEDKEISIPFSGNEFEEDVTVVLTYGSVEKTGASIEESGKVIFDGLGAGDYTIDIRYTADGCLSDAGTQKTVTIATVNELNAVITSKGVTCDGASDGFIEAADVSGGQAPYRYFWKKESEAEYSAEGKKRSGGLETGTYSSLVIDAGDCEFETTGIEIGVHEENSENGLKISQIEPSVLACDGDTDGKLNIHYTGNADEQEITIAISSGETVRTKTGTGIEGSLLFENLPAGEYQIRIYFTGAGDCEPGAGRNKTEYILAPAPVSAVFDYIAASCGLVADGAVKANVSGGIAPYTYQWLNADKQPIENEQSPTLENIHAGNYAILVTDFNECQTILPAIIPVSGLSVGEIIAENTKCVDSADGKLTITFSENTSNQQVYMETFVGDELIVKKSTDLSGSFVFKNLPAGNYPIRLYYDGAEVCAWNGTGTVSQPELLQAQFNITGTLCGSSKDGQITVIPTGGTAPFSFAWKDAAQNPAGGNTDVLSNLEAGEYSVTITDINNCTFDSEILTVSERTDKGTGPSISEAIVSGDRCSNEANKTITVPFTGNTLEKPLDVLLTFGSETKIEHSSEANGSVSFDNLGVGEYTIHIRYSESGCEVDESNAQTVNIENVEPLTADFNTRGVTCEEAKDGFIEATNVSGGTAPYHYEWRKEGEDGFTKTNTQRNGFTGKGIYTGRVVDFYGCIIEKDNLEIDVRPEGNNLVLGTIDYNEILCAGINSGTLNFPFSGNADLASVTISVMHDGQELLAGMDGIRYEESGNLALNNLAGGEYRIQIYYTGAESCALNGNQDQTVTINVPYQPVTADANVIGASCGTASDGRLSNVTISGGKTPHTYQWLDAGVRVSPLPDEDFIRVSAKNYTLKVTDGNLCEYTKEFTVPVRNVSEEGALQLEEAVFTSSGILCHGEEKGTVKIAYSGNTYEQEVMMNLQETGTLVTYKKMSALLSGEHTFKSLPAGNYRAWISFLGAEACEVSSALSRSQAIIQPPKLTATLTAKGVLCPEVADGKIDIVINGGTGAHTSTWYREGPSPEERVIINYQSGQPLGMGTYTCEITDDNGCTISETTEIGLRYESNLPELTVSNPVIKHESCYQGNNGSISVRYSSGVNESVEMIIEKTGSTETWTVRSSATSGYLVQNNLAPGKYNITVSYHVGECTLNNYAKTFEDNEIKALKSLELSKDIVTVTPTCLIPANGEITFSVSGWAGTHTAVLRHHADDLSGIITQTEQIRPYMLTQTAADVENQEAHFKFTGRTNGYFTLYITDECNKQEIERRINFKGIDPYTLTLDENRPGSILFVPCEPYDYGKYTFTFSGGNPDASVVEYGKIITTQREVTETYTEYEEQEVEREVIVYEDGDPVLDENGDPLLDENGNVITEQFPKLDEDGNFVTETVIETILVEVEKTRTYTVTDSELKYFELTDAEQNGNSFTKSNLTAGTYPVIYRSTLDGCRDTAKLNITIRGPEPLHYKEEILPVSCEGVDDGMITILPTRNSKIRYYMTKNGDRYTYYELKMTTVIKQGEEVEVEGLMLMENQESMSYKLHEILLDFKELEWYKEDGTRIHPVYAHRQGVDEKSIDPETATTESIHDLLYAYYDESGAKITDPVYHISHLPDYSFTERDENREEIEYHAVGGITLGNLPVGNYYYTFKSNEPRCIDAAGDPCVYSKSFKIENPTQSLKIDAVTFDAVSAVCDPKARQIKVNVSGGWGGYNYSLTNNEKEEDDENNNEVKNKLPFLYTGGEVSLEDSTGRDGKIIHNGTFTSSILSAGEYYLYVMDGYGCMVKHPAPISFADNNIKLSLLDTKTIIAKCPNDTMLEVRLGVTGGTVPYRYEMFKGHPEVVEDIFFDRQELEDTTVIGNLKPIEAGEFIAGDNTDGTDFTKVAFMDTLGKHGYFVYDQTGCGAYIEVTMQDERDMITLARKSLQDVMCYDGNNGEIEVWVKDNGDYTFYHALRNTSVPLHEELQREDFWTELTSYSHDIYHKENDIYDNYVYYTFSGLKAGKQLIQIENNKHCTQYIEFEINQPEKLTVLAEGSAVCLGGEQLSGNIFATKVSGGVKPYQYRITGDNSGFDINGDYNSEIYKKVPNDKNPTYTYHVKDDNGCVDYIANVGLKDRGITADLKFIASTNRYNDDVLLMIDMSTYRYTENGVETEFDLTTPENKEKFADYASKIQVFYEFYKNAEGTEIDSTMKQDDKRLYAYNITSKSDLEKLANEIEALPGRKETKDIDDSFFKTNFKLNDPVLNWNKTEFISFGDTILSKQLADRKPGKTTASGTPLTWLDSYPHYVGMTSVVEGCVYRLKDANGYTIVPLLIKNGDDQLYEYTDMHKRDILDVTFSPNPWILDDEELNVTVTFGFKVKHTIRVYNELGFELSSPMVIEATDSRISPSGKDEFKITHKLNKNMLSNADNQNSQIIIVTVSTERDAAAGKVMVIK
ncbi:MAG: right-handed parallel beta-helix repeat-containing protein [Prevotellaceae bacterium]|jgi:hypothetical protein|nr:right-handed parallel beta-helix repeat-containing protein [Prevotellaceae bacterium]